MGRESGGSTDKSREMSDHASPVQCFTLLNRLCPKAGNEGNLAARGTDGRYQTTSEG